ncbi:MAG TPA: PAS domain S-box protein, partial [Myxococcota bacterium]|nr:PAS domain S-box protein [Myxococcota bacterium]
MSHRNPRKTPADPAAPPAELERLRQENESLRALLQTLAPPPEDSTWRTEQAWLTSIMRTAPVGIGAVLDRTFLEVNARFCDMLGYRREELIGQSARLIYPDQEEFEVVGREKLRQIGERGKALLETRFRRKDGQILDIILTGMPLCANDLARGITFTALDISERKLAAAALKASEERFRALIEKTTDLVAILDASGRFIYGSPSFHRYTYAPERLERLDLEWVLASGNFIHPDDVAPVRNAFKLALESPGDTVQMVDFRLRTRDGEWRTLQGILTNLQDQPAIRGLIFHGNDITNRIKVEADLRWELRVASILSELARELCCTRTSAGDRAELVQRIAMALTDSQDCLVAELDAASGRLRPQAAAGDLATRCLAGEGVELASSRIAGAPAGDPPGLAIDARAMAGDQQVGLIALANSPRGFSDRERSAIQRLADLYAAHITHGRTLETLQDQRAQYQTLFESSPNALWLMDLAVAADDLDAVRSAGALDLGTHLATRPELIQRLADEIELLDVNQAGLAMFRLRGKDAALRAGARALFDQDLTMFTDGLLAIHAGEPVFRREGEITTPDGQRLEILCQWVHVPGYRSRALVTLIDQTQHKQLQEQLLHSQKMEAIGTLASGIAHDFNNLLTAILGNAELLRLTLPADTKLARTAEAVETAAHRAKDLTGKLLNFSRRRKASREPVDVHQIIADTVLMLQHTFDKQIRITLDLQAESATVSGDPGQLQQVFINLAVNGQQAMPEGGELIIGTRSLRPPAAGAGNAPGLAQAPLLKISVRDSGVGMSEEVRRRA